MKIIIDIINEEENIYTIRRDDRVVTQFISTEKKLGMLLMDASLAADRKNTHIHRELTCTKCKSNDIWESEIEFYEDWYFCANCGIHFKFMEEENQCA